MEEKMKEVINNTMEKISIDKEILNNLSKETMIQMVKIEPGCLKFLAENENLDQEVCLTAINTAGLDLNLEYCRLPDSLYNDEILDAICKWSYKNIQYIPKKFITKEFLEKVIKKSKGMVLQYIPNSMVNDEIISSCLKEMMEEAEREATAII